MPHTLRPRQPWRSVLQALGESLVMQRSSGGSPACCAQSRLHGYYQMQHYQM